jgi:hypothetical protein
MVLESIQSEWPSSAAEPKPGINSKSVKAVFPLETARVF